MTKTVLFVRSFKKLAGDPPHLGMQWLLANGYAKQFDQVRRKQRQFEILKPLPEASVINEALRKQHTQNLGALVEDALGELESLKDELQEWFDNLPENFQQGSKGEELQEAIDALDALWDNVDIDESLVSIPVVFFPGEGVESRADRCEEAVRQLRAVSDVLHQFLQPSESASGVDAALASEALTAVDEIIDGATEISFPQMR